MRGLVVSAGAAVSSSAKRCWPLAIASRVAAMATSLSVIFSSAADASNSVTEASVVLVVLRDELHLDSNLVVGQIVGRRGGIGRGWSIVLVGGRHCRNEAGVVLTEAWNQR
jgi:hypothetical protein